MDSRGEVKIHGINTVRQTNTYIVGYARGPFDEQTHLNPIRPKPDTTKARIKLRCIAAQARPLGSQLA